MLGRILPTLLVATALVFPAGALAQTSPYTTTLPTTSTQAPTTSTQETTTSESQPTTATSEVQPTATSGAAPTAVAPTAAAPTKLAYTGSNAWLLALVGVLALTGGFALVRSTRRV
jgi:LPXTG-motif cell wall-anchored protein